ncbi:hypothetical protein DS884_06445 [Tenacibaculum sp. E3R01]|uniref:hypothetical protein n=1 Tax=Tenacibaculum sp. E3R01 TaxID=2267227 RepID=UPI000DEAD894|nr:hypothetical protein [Tenacibaculum sp. E3R01]RBW59373.1 hypothetical protein DS884_06445 [Tenacibaculum sp. E3R01]
MELTKEQIQFIDNYLKENGIEYWDQRIEMVDHLVSDIELNSETTLFKSEFKNALERCGWNKNLREIHKNGWKTINTLYRKQFSKMFIDFFKSFKKVLVFFTLTLTYFFLAQSISLKYFKQLNIILYIIPIVFCLIHTVILYFKKFGKSVHINYGIFYFSFTFLILNMVIQFIPYTSEVIQKKVWLLLIPLYYVAMHTGYKIFRMAYTKIENIKRELSL